MADGGWSSKRGPVKDESNEKAKHREVIGKDIVTHPRDRKERTQASEARNPEKSKGQNLMKTKESSNKDNPWSQSSDRKEGISFAEMLKRNYPSIEKPVLTPDSSRSKQVTGSRPKRLNNDRSVNKPRSHTNRISADSFARIGQTTNDEMYVMGSAENHGSERDRRGGNKIQKPAELEVEFVAGALEPDDVLIEFVESKPVDRTLNKISFLTYSGAAKKNAATYVMSARPSSWSKIVEENVVKQPALADIHDMIREKTKAKIELTTVEREILRQKRRERRRREKEGKKREREEKQRVELVSNRGVKLGLISSAVLNQVSGGPRTSREDGSRNTLEGPKTRRDDGARNIRFKDEEYPSLGTESRKNETVDQHVVRTVEGGHLSDTGSEWETDVSEIQDQEVSEDSDSHIPEVQIQASSAEPRSYSSILRRDKSSNPGELPSGKSAKAASKLEIKAEQEVVKKKVKTKTPFEIDIFEALLKKKEPKVKKDKNKPVLGGKIKRDERVVRNQLDSSAPTKKRGKEREGGKKKKNTLMKKIIITEKEERRRRREEAEMRRIERIQTGVKMVPILQTEEDQENPTPANHFPNQENKKFLELNFQKEEEYGEHVQDKNTDPSYSAEKYKSTTDLKSGLGKLDNDDKNEEDAKTLSDASEDVFISISTSPQEEIKTSSAVPVSEENVKIHSVPTEEDIKNPSASHEVDSTKSSEIPEEDLNLFVNKEDVKNPETPEEIVKKKIHSRKFREYCDQDLSKDLDTYVTNLMSDLIRFQDRLHAKDPVKAKAKRRYIVGLRETMKFLKVKKVTCVILAPDLERISSEGGLDSAVDNIIRVCKEQSVQVVYSLGRYKLGRVCLRKVPVSCVAIMNHQGSDENYKNILELTQQLRESYQARLRIEIENLDPKAEEAEGTRPCSVLKYSPGKEFYPRGFSTQPQEQDPSCFWYQEQSHGFSYFGNRYFPEHEHNAYTMQAPDLTESSPETVPLPQWQNMLNILKG